VFLSEHSAVGIKSYNKCAKCSLTALTQAHCCFATHLLLCRCSLFGISPGASGVLSRYCCYGNRTAGAKPILKHEN